MGKVKNFILSFFICPLLLFSQSKLKPFYGVYLNNGFTEPLPSEDARGTKGLRAISYYLSAGAVAGIDSFFVCSAALRFGTERSRIEKELAPDNYSYYHLRNNTLALCVAPGLVLHPNHRIFLTLSIVRIFSSYVEGGGITQTRNSGYQFTYGKDLMDDRWDFRPGIKYQFKPFRAKHFAAEIGFEPSFVRRQVLLPKKLISGSTSEFYEVSYDYSVLYFGITY
jgi:hypothetical protein